MNIAKRFVVGFSLIIIICVMMTECRNLCEHINNHKEEQINDETSSSKYKTSTEDYFETTTQGIRPVKPNK